MTGVQTCALPISNYGINQLKPWVLSAKEVAGDNTDIVLVCANMAPETYTWLVEQGIVLFAMQQLPNVPVHVLRFLSIYEFLKQNWLDYEYVVTTDVKDVYFQADPFKKLQGKKLVVASEGLKYKDEPWGDDNLKQAYGPYVYELFKDKEIFNVGTFGGDSEYVKDMVFHIFTNGVNRPIPIVDQAVFNVMISRHPYLNSTMYTVSEDGWACQLGTTADPSKIDSFKPFLLEPSPKLEGEKVVTSTGIEYTIVHQYDRVPEWRKVIEAKYDDK